MRKKINLLVLLSIIFIFTSCSVNERNFNFKNNITSETILIYMNASDYEKDSLAGKKITDIIGCRLANKNVNIIMCTGGAEKWSLKEISNDECGIYSFENENLKKEYSLENKNMGESQTFAEFLDYVYKNYKTDAYSLIMYGRKDMNYSDELEADEIKEALQNSSLIKDKKKLKWTVFDKTDVKSSLESACELKDYMEYIIAPEEDLTREGMNYVCLEEIVSEGLLEGGESAESILGSAQKFYQSGKQLYNPEYSFTCIDTSKIDKVKDSLENLSHVILNDKEENFHKVIEARSSSEEFGLNGGKRTSEEIDIIDFSEKISTLYPEETRNLNESVKEAVKINVTNIKYAKGISVKFPFKYRMNSETIKNEMVKSEENSTKKDTELKSDEKSSYEKFLDKVNNTLKETENIIDIKKDSENKEGYEETLGIIYEIKDKGKISVHGTVKSSRSDINIFKINDETGKALECFAEEIKSCEDYSVYEIPVKLENQGKFKNAYIQFKKLNSGETEVTGIYSEGRNIKLKDEEKIVTLAADISLEEILNLKNSFSLDNINKFLVKDSINISGKINVSIENTEEKRDLETVYLKKTLKKHS